MLTELECHRLQPIIEFILYLNFLGILVMEKFVDLTDVKHRVPIILQEAKRNHLTKTQTIRKIFEFANKVSCGVFKRYLFMIIEEIFYRVEEYELEDKGDYDWRPFSNGDIKLVLDFLKLQRECEVYRKYEGKSYKDITDPEEREIIINYWLSICRQRKIKYTEETRAKIEFELKEHHEDDVKFEKNILTKITHDLSSVRKWKCGCYVKGDLVFQIDQKKVKENLNGVEQYVFTQVLQRYNCTMLYNQYNTYIKKGLQHPEDTEKFMNHVLEESIRREKLQTKEYQRRLKELREGLNVEDVSIAYDTVESPINPVFDLDDPINDPYKSKPSISKKTDYVEPPPKLTLRDVVEICQNIEDPSKRPKIFLSYEEVPWKEELETTTDPEYKRLLEEDAFDYIMESLFETYGSDYEMTQDEDGNYY
jgi:hypothetical protein